MNMAYRPADGEYGHRHSVNVLLFPQVDGLEQIYVWYSVFDTSLLEPVKHPKTARLPSDVFVGIDNKTIKLLL